MREVVRYVFMYGKIGNVVAASGVLYNDVLTNVGLPFVNLKSA